jgi:hypothetical protein
MLMLLLEREVLPLLCIPGPVPYHLPTLQACVVTEKEKVTQSIKQTKRYGRYQCESNAYHSLEKNRPESIAFVKCITLECQPRINESLFIWIGLLGPLIY